jgi:hypothetical protein
LTLEHLVLLVALLLAAGALLQARRSARRLEHLTESYWELRYAFGQLRERVTRLEGGEEPDEPPPPATGSFVPLSSLKK